MSRGTATRPAVAWQKRLTLLAMSIMSALALSMLRGTYSGKAQAGALTGVYFYLTLLCQDVDGWTALRTGLSWLFMNVPFLVVAQFTGRLSRRLSARVIGGGGCLVTASEVFNASGQVGTSMGLAILGAVGADAATSLGHQGTRGGSPSSRRTGLSRTAMRWQFSSPDSASSPPRSSPHPGYATTADGIRLLSRVDWPLQRLP